ncbi:DUF945 family protein [Orbus sturtevantii]|uniref:YdgA family protein n=1 Tax=Orbus sturtevantii TaxID=3074109 RepID=UPI00370D82CB
MKKAVIATSIIVILAIGYTVASWCTGNIIENNIDAKVIQITNEINQQQNLSKINIQYTNYHKGIFSTSFRLTVDAVNIEKDNTIIFDDIVTIYHGPFPWSEIKSADLSPKMAAFTYQTSKESNQQLWLAAGNKPFVTLSASIDYNENIKLVVNNEPINYTNEELDTNLQATKNSLSISIDNQFNNLAIKGEVNLLIFKNQLNEFEINNLEMSSKIVKQLDSGYQIKGNLSIDKGSISQIQPNNNDIKVNQLSINIDAMAQNKNITGDISTSVDSLFLGQQNLGQGEMLVNYTLPISGDLTAGTNNHLAVRNWFIKLDKLLWQNQQGNFNANFILNITDHNQTWPELDQDNLILAEANMHLPLNPMVYLVAQISNLDKEIPDDIDIESARQSVILFSKILFKNSPIIDFNNEPNNDIKDGIVVDLYYSKDENQARLKGKSITTEQFWLALSQNKLPHFE